MRHRKSGKKLGRNPAHRMATFRNLVKSLVIHERIRTTEAKGKAIRKWADKLVRYALENTVHARRKAYKILEDRKLVKKLFDEIGPRFKGVPGGFTRVVKLSEWRKGDGARMVLVEFSRYGQETTPQEEAKAETSS